MRFARPRLAHLLVTGLAALSLVPAQPVAANSPPAPPVVVSPQPTNVGPEDVHMELLENFSDPDGDSHAATDWEIRTEDGQAVVWAGYNSPVLTHAHFSDGTFQGPLAGQRQLEYRERYLFRVRFQDSRGAWSEWTERPFQTLRSDRVPPEAVRGILTQPAPTWRTDGRTPVALPTGAQLSLETARGTTLLTLASGEQGMAASPGPLLEQPETVRVRLSAPAEAELRLPSSVLAAVTDHGQRLRVYLPAVRLPAGGQQIFWLSQTGATFYPDPDRPDSFSRERLARDTPLPWQLEPGYRIEAVGSTFQLPTSLAFVPNPSPEPDAPRFYVTELHGRIKVVTNSGRAFTFADNLLNFDPSVKVPGDGEQGVIGICIPPDNHGVYATMVRVDEKGYFRIKIVRFRSDDGLRATSAEDVLVAGSDQGRVRPSHQIQQCSFGPDGKLYAFVADGTGPKQASDEATFNGKVLRMNLDGTAPADNPRFDPANPAAAVSYQYTRGHRNAYGQAWRPSTGQLYMTENGPNVDRLIALVPGQHYGWDGSDESMRMHAAYVWPEAHWAPVGLTFVEGEAASALPADKYGHLLVASSGVAYSQGPQRAGKAIQEFRFNPDGSINQSPTIFARYVGEGRGTFIDLKLQPDGLYFTDIYLHDDVNGPVAPGGKVWRIAYAGQASFTASAQSDTAPLTVTFSDTSTVADAIAWQWDFGDGTTSTERSPVHTFSTSGRYVVALTVTSPDGQSSEHLQTITITDPDGAVPDSMPVQPLAAPASPAAIFFPETGVVLGGGFKHYWEHRGGLAQFGYPLTEEFQEVNPADGQTYTVQYFERARFEYHPEHKGTLYETELGLLGWQASRGRAEAAFQPQASSPEGALFFEQTGHAVAPIFREHWEATGGVDINGMPISEPVEEAILDGPRYLVQYFERVRLEYHPAFAGTIEQVRVARLGTQLQTFEPSRPLP